MNCVKIKYRDKQAAEEDIAHINKKKKVKRTLYAYACPHCNCWHLSRYAAREVLQKQIDELKIKLQESEKEKLELLEKIETMNIPEKREARILARAMRKKEQGFGTKEKKELSEGKKIKLLRTSINELIAKNLKLEEKLKEI